MIALHVKRAFIRTSADRELKIHLETLKATRTKLMSSNI